MTKTIKNQKIKKMSRYNQEEEESYSMNIKLIKYALIAFALSLLTFFMVEFKTVKGGELGVMETWGDGVVNEVYQPKNYWLFPGFSKEMFTYDATLQRSHPYPYEVKSSDNQKLDITSYTQWRIIPSKLVQLHKTVGKDVENKVINPALTRALLIHATKYKAIDAYSGDGLVKLQKEIQEDLLSNTNILNDGISIEAFVIQHVTLDSNYVDEINKRQLATLRQTRAVEEQKAAEAEALVAKSKAQADLNTKIVEAERDQQVKVIAAKAASEQVMIEIKANAEKVKMEAEAKKTAAFAEAEGLLKLGEAKASAQKLQLQAYAAPGSELYVKVEVSKNLADAYKNIKGYLPSDMKLNLLTDSFDKSVDILTGNALVKTNLTGK